MDKKYFIYISSTDTNLKNEKIELCRLITELGAIPICMDGFDISEEEDRRIIRKSLESCDYFINITAFKRGEMIGSSSVSELEYSWAIKSRIPVFALIISDTARWKDSKKEKEEPAKMALEDFKAKLRQNSNISWNNIGDLKSKTLALISREMFLKPRQGWVPSDEMMNSSVANEMSRLIRENETLKSRLRMEGTDIVKRIRSQMRQALRVMSANRVSLSFYYTQSENWENTKSFRYIKIFRLLAPELISSKTIGEISHFLGNILNPDLDRVVRKDFPTPSNTIKKIMTDLALLKMARYTGNGENEVWELTEYGKETFSVFRLRQMNRNMQKLRAEKT